MSSILITSVDDCNSRRYRQSLEVWGAQVQVATPGQTAAPETLMDGVGGLLLSGGPDVDPELYGAAPDPEAGLELCRPLDEMELRLLELALDRDMPVLAICRGMQLLNVARGGTLIQDLPGHRARRERVAEDEEERWGPSKHYIYLSPGAKTAAVLGNGGFFRVNSWHHQGLREPQRSPRLMTTAYSLEDGIIEGLESPEHSWVIGLQCHPERPDEVPRQFVNLFAALVERAELYLETRRNRLW